MSREHAPAVKELAEKLLALILPDPLRTSPPEQIASTLDEMADKIDEALDPLLDKSRTVCHWVEDDSDICHNAHESFDSELVRWEPPKMEAK